VSNHVKTVGFVFPVALTREVWLTLVNIRYDHSLIERNPRAVEQRIFGNSYSGPKCGTWCW